MRCEYISKILNKSNYLKRRSIRTNLIFLVGILILLPLCVALFTLGGYLRKISISNTISTNRMLVTQVASDTDNIIREVNYVTSMLMVNQNMLTNIRMVESEKDIFLNYQARYYISQKIGELESTILNTVNGKIMILTPSGYLISSNNRSKTNTDYSQYTWYHEIVKNGRKNTWIPNIELIFKETMTNDIFPRYDGLYYGRSILGYDNKLLGIIFVKLSGNHIWKNYINTLDFSKIKQANKSFYILSEEKQLLAAYNYSESKDLDALIDTESIWSLNANQLVTGQIRGRLYYIAMKLSNSPNVFLFTEDIDSFFRTSHIITNNMFVFIAIVVILTYVILIYISWAVSTPLQKLIDNIENSESGLVEFVEEGLVFLEIENLAKSYNEAGRRILELIENVKQESSLKEKEHYEVLFSQISPHFIFNTVNSIKWLSKNDTRVFEALEALGDILHSVYGNKADTTTIGSELKLLNAYIKIMKMRFEYEFNYTDIIPVGFYDYEIPIFTLQPLVENAILHGIRTIQFGQIVVSAVEEDKGIVISVFNNGKMIEKDKLDSILEGKENWKSKVTGIGLYNVNSRIKMLYGNEYGLSINTERQVGIEVYISIPNKKKENNEK